jgi:hypothetical protein
MERNLYAIKCQLNYLLLDGERGCKSIITIEQNKHNSLKIKIVRERLWCACATMLRLDRPVYMQGLYTLVYMVRSFLP